MRLSIKCVLLDLKKFRQKKFKNKLYYQNGESFFMSFNSLIYRTHFPKKIEGVNTAAQSC